MQHTTCLLFGFARRPQCGRIAEPTRSLDSRDSLIPFSRFSAVGELRVHPQQSASDLNLSVALVLSRGRVRTERRAIIRPSR